MPSSSVLLVLSVVLLLLVVGPTFGFETGKKYVYHYESRVATGVSDQDAKQFAGRGFEGTLTVTYDGTHLAFQPSDLKVSSFNQKLDVNSLFDKVESQYKPIDAGNSKEKAFQENFEKPFWADYKDGVIGNIYFEDHSVPEAAVNGKKAIVSLFQTNFQPLVHEGSHVYKLYEDGIGGDCNTLYHVAHHPEDDHPEEHVLNVTKVRFYDECKNRPHLLFSTIYGSKCQSCELHDFKAVKNLGRTDYKIKGTKQKFTIERIDSSGVILFTPFSTNGQTIISAVNQTLELVEVVPNDAGGGAQFPGSGARRDASLTFRYNDDGGRDAAQRSDLTRAHFYDRYHPVEHVNDEHVRKVEGYLSHIKSDLEGLDENARYVAKLIKALRHLDYDELTTLFATHVKPHVELDTSSPDEQDVRSVLHRILPLVGTNPSIKFMFDLIRTKKMSAWAATNAVTTFAFHVKEPSATLLEFVKSQVDSDDDVYRHVAHRLDNALVLALGTLVFRSCVEDDFNSHPAHAQTHVDDATCTGIVRDMINRYEKSSSGSDDTLITSRLRALANTRHSAAFNPLVSVAKTSRQLGHRLIAVWGLFNFAATRREEVIAVFLPILFDPTEDHELRSYAFEGLLYSDPKPEFFANLAQFLNKETNDKVANYVHAALTSYANSTDPCVEPFKYSIRQTLDIVKPRFRDLAMHGTNRLFSAFDPAYNYGRTTHFISIANNMSVIPRDLYLRQAINVLGYNFDVVEAGFVADVDHFPITDYLIPLLGRQAGMGRSRDDSNHVGTKGKSRGDDAYGRPKHDYELSYLRSGSWETYRRHMGQFAEVGSFHDSTVRLMELLSEIVTEPVQLSDLMEKTRSAGGAEVNVRANKMHYIDVEYSVPNEMGMPVVIAFTVPTTLKVSGRATVRDSDDGKLQLSLDLKVGTGLYMTASMYVNSAAFGKFGYALKTDTVIKVPVKAVVGWNRSEKHLEFDYTPSAEPYDVYHHRTVPLTFNDGLSVPVSYADRPTRRRYSFGHDYFGAGLTFNFTYDYKRNDYGSYRNFFKSFFKKASSYEDYFQLADKWYAGSGNFMNYALFNPTAKPFHLRAEFSRSRDNPTSKVHTVIKRQKDSQPDEDNFIKRKLEVEMTASGSVERKWEAVLEIDNKFPYGDVSKLEFRFNRSALPGFDKDSFEFCYNSAKKISKLWTAFDPILAYTSGDKVKWEYSGKLNVGRGCRGNRQVVIKGVGEKSEWQLMSEREHSYYNIPIYNQCMKTDYNRGYQFSYACWLVRKDLGRLNKFTFDVQYNNVPDYVRSYALRLYGWFRHTFYNNLEIDHSEGNKDPNRVQITANFSYFDPVLDVKVVREGQTVYYHDLFVPSVVPNFEPITFTEDAVDRYLRRIVNYHKPLCILSGNFIRTLDKVVYEARLSSCYHVAFADFYSHKTAVLVANDDGNKNVIVVLSNVVVEIGHRTLSTVTVNGNEKEVPRSQPIYVDFGDDADRKIMIYKYFDGVVVKSASHGFEVFTDGRNVKIQPSPLLRGQPTGLCGNFDGDSSLEFVNQFGDRMDSVEKFVDHFQSDKCK